MRLRVTLSLVLLAGISMAADAVSEALFKDGKKKYEAGDYVAALQSFEQAYTRTSSPAALLSVGTTLKALGRFAEAADAYEAYLAHPAANPTKRAETERALAESLKSVGTLQLDVQSGAKVSVDGRDVHRSLVRVDPGPHVVVVDDGQGSPLTTQIGVTAGVSQVVSLRRAPAPAAVAVPTPPPAEPAAAPASVRRPASSRRTIGYVLSGVGATGAAVALVTAISLASKKSTVNDLCDQGRRTCSSQDGVDAAHSGANTLPIYYGGLAVGVVGVGAGAYLLWSSGEDNAKSTLRLGPLGASIEGRF